MRAFLQLQTLISEDVTQLQKLLDEEVTFDDSDPVKASTYQSTIMTLAGSAGDTAVPFGGVTHASLVIIIPQQEVAAKLNYAGSGSVAAPIRPTPASISGTTLSQFQQFTQPGLMVWRGRVDAIWLSNPNSTPATALVVLLGEAS